jgi:hypothetical protein
MTACSGILAKKLFFVENRTAKGSYAEVANFVPMLAPSTRKSIVPG